MPQSRCRPQRSAAEIAGPHPGAVAAAAQGRIGGTHLGAIARANQVVTAELRPAPKRDNGQNDDAQDLPHWTTVHRNLTDTLDALDAAGQQAARLDATRRDETEYFPDPLAPHAAVAYQETALLLDEAAERARQGSQDPQDLAALEAVPVLEPCTHGRPVHQDWVITRVPP